MPRSHVELSLEERKILARLLHHKTRVAEIAHVLSRHRSTIYRETGLIGYSQAVAGPMV